MEHQNTMWQSWTEKDVKWKIMPIACSCNTAFFFFMLGMLLFENDQGTKEQKGLGMTVNCKMIITVTAM